MKVKKYLLITCVLLIIFCNGIYFSRTNSISNFSNRTDGITSKDTINDVGMSPRLSSVSNNDIIESIFTSKVDDYNNFSYYPQIYESSLQATYYALYILNALGKLDTINQTAIINYILSHYESSSNRFMDSLSYRYLSTDVSRNWCYPFSSTLETTCYAVLSLELLDSLDLIDTQDIIEYLWSCYNTDKSGFIGQPYESTLPTIFKKSTMDNTFFAVITLDMLMNDWLMYTNQKNEIIQFVNDLQIPGGASWQAGGFFNDRDTGFDSLNPLFEPNLLSSFYCIKTLEVFGMEDTINKPDFHQFLNNSYDSLLNYFHIAPWEYTENLCNIVATALGLELSDITEFTEINRAETINFILSNRNSLGNWDQSTTITQHELIDTFQIIRSLENSQVISQLTLEERNQIGNATQLYCQTSGYSLLSKDFTSMNLVNTIVHSFELYGKIAEIDIQEFYTQITGSFTENYLLMFTNSFMGYLQKSSIFGSLRSFPIEYFSDDNLLRSHKTTYYALDSLSRMFKLDDFLSEIDGNELISDIVATQFLNDSYYDNYGAFTPLWPYNSYYESSFLNSKIFFEYSYYAIRCLELLAEQLDLGNLTSLGVDTMALYSHIDRNIAETSTELYYDPSYTSNIEKILENTYYMIYILKALDMYEKDTQKIRNFVIDNLDYTNIKNIYFSYKILEILNLGMEFDTDLTYELIKNIYNEILHEFYLTEEKLVINQEIFLWICEMARNSKITIEVQYPSVVQLGGNTIISAILSNLLLRDFGSYITFKFTSDLLGTHVLNKTNDHVYLMEILIPVSPKYFPKVDGELLAYEGKLKKAELNISFSTTYSVNYTLLAYRENNTLSIEVNTSIYTNGNSYPIIKGNVSTHIYKNGTFIEEKYFSHQDFIDYSKFLLNYTLTMKSIYDFRFYLEDGFQESSSFIGNMTFNEEIDDGPDNPEDDPNDDPNDRLNKVFKEEIEIAIPLMITFIAAPGSLIIISSKQLKKSKKTLRYN